MTLGTDENLYLVALGSNLGDRWELLADAAHRIETTLGPVLAHAQVYETEPVGAADQLFLNSALVCASLLAPEAALAQLLAIEAVMGRVRREKWGNRPIDLDLLLWRRAADAVQVASRTYVSPSLTLPHPRLLERDFVLIPAVDVAADWVHPATGRTLAAELTQRAYPSLACPSADTIKSRANPGACPATASAASCLPASEA